MLVLQKIENWHEGGVAIAIGVWEEVEEGRRRPGLRASFCT